MENPFFSPRLSLAEFSVHSGDFSTQETEARRSQRAQGSLGLHRKNSSQNKKTKTEVYHYIQE